MLTRASLLYRKAQQKKMEAFVPLEYNPFMNWNGG